MAEVADNQRHSEKEKYGFSADKAEYTTKTDNKVMANGYGIHGDSWFKEVLELRKKAGEYKVINIHSITLIFFL